MASGSICATDLGSKFGTFIRKDSDEDFTTKLDPNSETPLTFNEDTNTAQVKLGAYTTVLTIKRINVNPCTTTFTPALDQSQSDSLSFAGSSKTLNLLPSSPPTTTHLVATVRRPTLKFIACQLSSVPVVTPGWAAALAAMSPTSPWPEEADYTVPDTGTQVRRMRHMRGSYIFVPKVPHH